MAAFLTAEWRKLIMVQYVVEPEVLLPFLPVGVELDLFEGRCFVSVVAFLFDKVRVRGIAFPLHTRFEEVNLRFYVRRVMADGTVRRGVVFVRELVPRLAIACVARWLYEEPYVAAPTRSAINETADSLDVRYEWKFGGRWHAVGVNAAPKRLAMTVGSEEEFLTEHYWGYTKRTRGATSEYAVEHPRWMTYAVRDVAIDVDYRVMYGEEFAFLNDAPVASVLLAEGAPVSVSNGTRLHASAQRIN